jgi:hypothetical protein
MATPIPSIPEALVPALAFMPTRLEPAAAFILGRPLATCVPLRPACTRWETLPPQPGQLRWLLDCPKGNPDLARFGIVITATKEDGDPTCGEIERYDVVYVSPKQSPLPLRRYGNLLHAMVAAEWLADQVSAHTPTASAYDPLPVSRPALRRPVGAFRADGPTRPLALGPVHAVEDRVGYPKALEPLWNRFLALPDTDPRKAALLADRIAGVPGRRDALGETGGRALPSREWLVRSP